MFPKQSPKFEPIAITALWCGAPFGCVLLVAPPRCISVSRSRRSLPTPTWPQLHPYLGMKALAPLPLYVYFVIAPELAAVQALSIPKGTITKKKQKWTREGGVWCIRYFASCCGVCGLLVCSCGWWWSRSVVARAPLCNLLSERAVHRAGTYYV